MRTCIFGDPQDLSSVYMSWLAERRGIDIIKLSEEALGVTWTFFFDDLCLPEGYIEVEGAKFRFSELSGAFVRLHPQPGFTLDADMSPGEKDVMIVERRGAIQYLLNNLPFVVANRPSSGRSNGSKPYQMSLLTAAGFEVPEWVASNDKDEVVEFSGNYPGGVVYKACSGLRSRVRSLDDELLQRLKEGTSPVVVQVFISGRDVRVHVVKQLIFATGVISDGIDYRYDNEKNDFFPVDVPDLIADLCRAFADREGLTIAGFDFRVTEDGRWYCLESNPVPTFLPYEMSTGQKIGDAILDTFAGTST